MKPSFHRTRSTFAAVLFLMAAIPAFANPSGRDETIRSPDGRIQVVVHFPDAAAHQVPHWSATFQGRLLLKECGLGLELTDEGELFSGARLVREQRRSVHRDVPMLFGKSDRARDHYREARFSLESRGQRRLEVVFRCYDDGVALRYELPADGSTRPIVVQDESTSFGVAGSPTAHVQHLENHKTSHEHQVVAVPCDEIAAGKLVDMPLTLAWTGGIHAAITEASLRRYAGMALMRPPGGAAIPRLVCRLTPRADGTKVARPLPMETPWRVVLIGDRPGALLESTTIYCLNEPPAIGDTSWIQPGKITFHWWNGDVHDGRPGPPMLSFEMNQRYLDFCAREGIPTHSITSTEGVTTPWYHQSNPGVAPGPDTDPTRPRDSFDLGRIRQYAESRKVRLWTWVHQGALRGRVEEAFAAFERMGWTGMMVDFFDHDDQEHVELVETILQAAARHHLLIQLHGIWKPTGLERTYPNLVNHEGALNLEYLKWSALCTPEHSLNMAFTRLIAGPMDYHLGGFRAVPRAAFKAQHVAPNVLGTRGHMLGMYVCFDNPNPMLADFPTAYENQPGFDFLKLVPTWWDETRVLMGRVGEVLVTARRKGNDWYLGGLSARETRDLSLPLSFLGRGRYDLTVWQDAPETATDPNRLETKSGSVSRRDTLSVRVAVDGGFAARLRPARN